MAQERFRMKNQLKITVHSAPASIKVRNSIKLSIVKTLRKWCSVIQNRRLAWDPHAKRMEVRPLSRTMSCLVIMAAHRSQGRDVFLASWITLTASLTLKRWWSQQSFHLAAKPLNLQHLKNKIIPRTALPSHQRSLITNPWCLVRSLSHLTRLAMTLIRSKEDEKLTKCACACRKLYIM